MIARALLTTAPLQIVQAILGLATIWAFTRLLTPSEYGSYALILSASVLAHALAFTWAESAALRFLPDRDKARANHFATLTAIALAVGVVSCIALLLASRFAPLGAALAVGAAFFRFLSRLMRETERADQRSAAFVLAEIAYYAGGFGVGVLLLATTQLGVAAPFAGLLTVSAGLAIRDGARLARLSRGGAVELARLSRYARYGLPLAAALALDAGVQAGVRAILAWTHGPAEAGAYAAAFGLARPIDLICAWMGLSAAPVLLAAWRDGPQAVANTSRQTARALLLLALPAAAGLALVARPLAAAMVGEGLAASAAAALPWLAMAGLMSGFALHFWSEAFQLAERTDLRLAIVAGAGLLQLALTAVLAPTHGAVGAAIAAAAGAGIAAGALALVGQRLAPVAFAGGDMLRIGAATAIMAGAVLLAPSPAGPQALATSALVGVVAYALAIAAFGGTSLRADASAFLQPIGARLAILRPR